MGEELSFRHRSVNIGPIYINYYSKGVKVVYWFKKISTGDSLLLGSTENTGDGKTPFLSQKPMHFTLPTCSHNLPCAVPHLTGMPAITAKPTPFRYLLQNLRGFCSLFLK